MKIFIFGLGHLSRFLVDEMGDEFNVSGTWRTEKKGFDKLTSSVKFSVGDSLPEGIEKNYDCVVWSFPPVENYQEVLKEADQHFETSIPWIFVSSTSVFESGLVDEDSERTGSRFRGANLVEIEDYLYSLKRKISIIRPSGLVDEKRNPVNFFLNKTDDIAIKGQEVNLVHTLDVARFLKWIIKNNLVGEDFNLNSETKMEKSLFYGGLLKLAGSTDKKFVESKNQNSKTVSSEKSRGTGFKYQYDDLYKYFENLLSS